jgi:sugar/nucleoside kinase (ribokinase family)
MLVVGMAACGARSGIPPGRSRMPDNAKSLDVIVAGELYADLILGGFEFWPEPGQEAFAKDYHRAIGGGTSITACGMAKLGSRTAVLGVIGADGEWLIEQLEGCGVATAQIVTDPQEPTGFTVAVTGPHDRAFFTYPGANRGFRNALAIAAAAERLYTARHVHLAYSPNLATAPELFEQIRANGCTLSLDVGFHEEWLRDPRTREVLRRIDIFFPNAVEAQQMTGETDPRRTLCWFADAGMARVALKLGPLGAALLWDGDIIFGSAPHVEPLDTTGAGDCFDAGFLHGWLRGEPPERCLAIANICGAYSTEAYGGIMGFPDAERVERELEGMTCEK